MPSKAISPTKPPDGQAFSAPDLQAKQWEQEMLGWTATFWPMWRWVMEEPSVLIVPENSWPIVIGIFSFVTG